MAEHSLSSVTSELVTHGIPRWFPPDTDEPVRMPKSAWWLSDPLEGSRGTLHVCGQIGGDSWQLEVGYCLDCEEVVDMLAIENYCGHEVASMGFWPGLKTAIVFALSMVELWEEECERAQ